MNDTFGKENHNAVDLFQIIKNPLCHANFKNIENKFFE